MSHFRSKNQEYITSMKLQQSRNNNMYQEILDRDENKLSN